MAKPRHSWGSMTKESRERASADAARYGLTRRQARERYNRGTYRPFAKDPVNRAPQNAPHKPEDFKGGTPESLDDLRERALANMDRRLGDDFKYVAGRFRVVDSIYNHAPRAALIRMAGASEDEIRAWAHYQSRGKYKPPTWLEQMGWRDSEGNWNNPFWYH